MRRSRRALALLLVVVALGVVDALLAMLWLWSRAEAREAVESLAVSRAEWAAAAALTDAVRWLAARDSLGADTVLRFVPAAPGVVQEARLRRHAADLIEVRAEGRADPAGTVVAQRVRCLWMAPGTPDSAGNRRFDVLVGTTSPGC
ncbi:MAG TPA: hypothetical protein VFY20_07125 [Gemmatimonadales bacterium]|nr:hypothetical protein [Gemmatimonadales bacterium]